MEKCNDSIFGEMIYDHRWYKSEEETIFGQPYEVKIVASAYTGRPITDAQRIAYKTFIDKKEEYYESAAEQLTMYINDNFEELKQSYGSLRKVEKTSDLREMVTPTTILFKQNGTALILLECTWDEENGVAVELAPDTAVGSQDLFL